MSRFELDDLIKDSSFVKVLLENQSDLVMLFDKDGVLKYANERMSPFLQSIDDPYVEYGFLNCLHHQDRCVFEQIIKEADRSCNKVILRMWKESEKNYQELDFQLFFIDSDDGNDKSILMIGKEVPISMEIMTELVMNDTIFRSIFQFLPDFVFLIHKKRILNRNNAVKALLETEFQSDDDLLDIVFEYPETIIDALERRDVLLPEVKLIGANGSHLICDASIVYLSVDSETAVIMLHDRTATDFLVDRLEHESFRYRTLFENMQTGMAEQKVLYDDNGKVLDLEYVSINPAFVQQTGLPNTVIGKGIRKVMPNFEDFWYDMFVRVALTGKSEYGENYVADVDRWYSVFVFSTGEDRVAQIFLDISGQKKLETNLTAALHEREILVKELHHRVQNNLQMIKGIIAMQYMRIDDPNVRVYLQEAESRIQAMGQVHLSLYSSDRLSSIDLAKHLRNLVEEVADSFDKELELNLEMDGSELQLGLEESVALSIVINELLTNSFKFAFHGQKNGKIDILIKNRFDSFTLVYQDFGEGYPLIPPVINSGSLGLNLVQNLVHRQLRGQIVFSNNDGARAEIVIPKKS